MGIMVKSKRVVVIIYVTAMFMVAMDGTIVNVALAAIGNGFNVPPSATGGINIGYLVSIAIFLPMAGWLGDRFGTKRIFLIALGVFTFASTSCGLAGDIRTLNLFRAFQGAGGGLLTPVGMAMLFRTFSPEERPKVSRSLILPIAVAPAVGPIIGGMIVERLSWRWVFFINFPIGVMALLLGSMLLAEHRESSAGHLDLPGFLLSAPGFSILMYTLTRASTEGWNSPVILCGGACSLILIASLVCLELRAENPMLDLRLLSDRLFRRASLISLLSVAALMGMLFIFPLMYQNLLKASALESGMVTFPEALGLMTASRLMAWSSKRLGMRRVVSGGLLFTIPVFVLISMVGAMANPWIVRVLFFGIGFFLGHTVVTVQFLAFNNIASASIGRATTLFNVQNRIGSAIGIVMVSSLLSAFGTTGTTAAYGFASLSSAVFLLAALILASHIKEMDIVTVVQVQADSSYKTEQYPTMPTEI